MVREVFLFAGPALIVSMAYMDPGNYGTDIGAGASFNYGLLWTVWMANLMAMLLQYLSGKLGIATGRICRSSSVRPFTLLDLTFI